jgi:hypothetical protein
MRKSKSAKKIFGIVLLTLLLLPTVSVFAARLPGAIFTTTPDGGIVNENVHYESKLEVYLDGGPPPHAPQTAAGLPDGYYVFQVTNPSGAYLLSQDPAKSRIVEVEDGIIIGLVLPSTLGTGLTDFYSIKPRGNTWITYPVHIQDDPDGVAGSSGRHDTNTDIDHGDDGAIVVQLMPFLDTPNPGGVYKAWMIPLERYLSNGGDLDAIPGGVKNAPEKVKGKRIGYFPDPGFGPPRDQIKTDNFKVKLEKPPVPPAELSILKFHDVNANSIWDLGEPEITGWLMTITDPLDVTNIYASPVSIVAEPIGTYIVVEEIQAGWIQSAVYVDTVGQALSQEVSVLVTQSGDHEVVFGNFMPGDVYGIKYDDLNGNGAHDEGEPGVEGVVVIIEGVTNLGDTVSGSTTTDLTGFFGFTGLVPGSYTVTEIVPAGSWASTETSVSFELLSGDSIDLGYVFGNLKPAEIHGAKFNDLNGNGEWDEGEPGVPGLTVTLTGTTGKGETIEPVTTTTSGDGTFSFVNLWPGDYTVTETVPQGWIASTPTSVDITLISGEVELLGWVFGNYEPAAIDGYKYEDRDGDGVHDDGETGIEGVTVTLTGTTGKGVAILEITSTDIDGYFSFTDLAPGTYKVEETVPAGWVPSTATFVEGIVLESGDSVHLVFVFGNYEPVDISAYKFFDANGNGVQDEGEPPMAGIKICLTKDGEPVTQDAYGNLVESCQFTGEDGWVHWSAMTPGTYTVTEDLAGSGIFGLTPTTLVSVDVNVVSGQETVVVEFGNYAPCIGLTPGYWKNWRNHYTDAEFELLLEDTIAESIAEADAIFEHWDASDPSDLTILKAFTLANQLTVHLTQNPELPNPSGGSMFGFCTLYLDGEWVYLGETLEEALAIMNDVGSYEDWYILYIKNILDTFANSTPS